MPLNVGNVIADPFTYNSFISLEDASKFLEDEAAGAAENTPLGRWFLLPGPEQEASLVRVSRWLAVTVSWCEPITVVDLPKIGLAAARLAVEAAYLNLYAGEDSRGELIKAKADTVEVQWAGSDRIGYKAAGKRWGWLDGYLRGLVCDPKSKFRLGVMVV